MLKETFIQLLTMFTGNESLKTQLWTEIEKNYSGKKRYYHNLAHLDNLLAQLTEVKNDLQQWETVLFTLFYHDIVYNPLKQDNEEKSAALAAERLGQAGVPDSIIAACKAQILATQSHRQSADADTNYFTDADLCILGQSWDTYTAYYKNVRKEYAIYPGLVYNPGRRKVLLHFLQMERIFKTEYFYRTFEERARENLERELLLY